MSAQIERPFIGCEDKVLTHNLNADPRFLGLELSLVPNLEKISSPRSNMHSGNVVQALPIDGCEHPLISTGFEPQFTDYSFDLTRRDQDITVLAVIPKFDIQNGNYRLSECNSYTIVYKGEDDKKVGCFDLNTYTSGANGFGYENVINKGARSLLRAGSYISKDTVLSHPPTVDGNRFMLGVNAKTAYMSLDHVGEDAFIISKSLARKMETIGLTTLDILIGVNQIPLNLYGTPDLYKAFPNIGEDVGDDGVLMALRRVHDYSMIVDTRPQALTKTQIYDDTIYAEPNATVVDLDVYINKPRRMSTPPEIFEQIYAYSNNRLRYHKQLFEVYQHCVSKYMELSVPFIALVTRSIEHMIAYGQRVPDVPKRARFQFTNKRDRIDFVHLSITYKSKVKVNKGFKITGRDGSKGVVNDIWEDEDMPVNEFGDRADLIHSNEGTINRMNPSQLQECWFNYVSSHVARQSAQMLEEGRSVNDAYLHILGYVNDINPMYAMLVAEEVDATPNGEAEYVQACIDEGIYLVTPQFLETLRPELNIELKNKYNIPLSPVTFNLRDDKGNLLRTVTSRKDVVVGAKYIYCLCKVPVPTSSGLSTVNQMMLPIRQSVFQRKTSPYRIVPSRFGEDENRNLLMNLHSLVLARFAALHSNSPKGVFALADTILNAENPSAFGNVDISTEELIKTSVELKMMWHMFSTIGIDAENINVTEDTFKPKYTKEEERNIATILDGVDLT